MRPYGIDRLEMWPDKGDIAEQARKSRIGALPRKNGEYRSHTKSSASKRATRRLFKRAARRAGRIEANEIGG
jgi:hypothetical protein